MSILRDQDLLDNLTSYVDGADLPADHYSKDSPVQAASLDLHIGSIYLPGKEENEAGGVQDAKLDVELKPGATAVVVTKEILHLPGDVAGFGFPPSRVSFKGLLMTNPGHVDPGYQGVMRFAVINMAEGDYHLKAGERIVRLLLFKLSRPAHADWLKRNPKGSHLPTQADVNLLSKDFVNVEKRAQKIARKYGAKISALIAGGLTAITLLLGLVSSGHLFHNEDIETLKKKQEILEYDLKNRVDIERKVQDLETRLKELEKAKAGPITDQKKVQSGGTTGPGKHL